MDDADEGAHDGGLEEALARHARARRRTMLKALGIGAAVVAAGTAGTVVFLQVQKSNDKKRAGARAKDAEAELLRGNVRAAKKIAEEARGLDRMNFDAWLAFIHANGMDLIDGDGGAEASVALMADARNSGGKGATLEFVSLAGAIGIKNDVHAEKLLRQPHAEPVDGDGFYAYAAGAAYDLVCDDASIGWYTQALELRPGCVLSRIRLARAYVLVGAYDDARTVIDGLPSESFERLVLGTLVTRVESIEKSKGASVLRGAQVDRARLGDLPRSLRTLGTALALEDPDQPWGQSAGLDAALDDADTPMIAILAGKIALADGDRVSARAAASAALRMHEDLAEARVFGARMALVDGDWKRADELAGAGPDRSMIAILKTIQAYEAGDRAGFERVRADDPDALVGWPLDESIKALLDAKAPADDALDTLAKRGEPWADLLAIDAALLRGEKDKAKKLVQQWMGALTPAQQRRKDRVGGVLPPPAPAPPIPSASTSASAGANAGSARPPTMAPTSSAASPARGP